MVMNRPKCLDPAFVKCVRRSQLSLNDASGITKTNTTMINYSIVMRSVNANLFEINQAKSRINAAVKAGETPAQADLDLVATEVQNAYAIAQYADVMTIEKFAKHISTHGCVYSRADISAILYMAVDCMREQLLEGKKIRLGDLGDFSVSLQSKGAETAKAFTAQNITGVNVVWDCGQEFKNLLADAEFNLVASRSAQAAVLKAVKAGETVVDLNKPAGNDNDDDNPGGGGNTPSGGNTNQGSGTNTNRQYTISVTSANTAQGTVTGGGTYSEGSRVNVTATPKSGYAFDKWSDGNTQATRTINVTQNLSLTASFKAVSSGGNTEPGGEDDKDNPDFL